MPFRTNLRKHDLAQIARNERFCVMGRQDSLPVASETTVANKAGYRDGAVRSTVFYCLTSGGGVNREQTESFGEAYNQEARTEVPLNEGAVASFGFALEPGTHRGEVAVDSLSIGGNVRPSHPYLWGHCLETRYPESTPGIRLLFRQKFVIEYEEEGAVHTTFQAGSQSSMASTIPARPVSGSRPTIWRTRRVAEIPSFCDQGSQTQMPRPTSSVADHPDLRGLAESLGCSSPQRKWRSSMSPAVPCLAGRNRARHFPFGARQACHSPRGPKSRKSSRRG